MPLEKTRRNEYIANLLILRNIKVVELPGVRRGLFWGVFRPSHWKKYQSLYRLWSSTAILESSIRSIQLEHDKIKHV